MFGLRGFEMRKQKKILAALLAAGLLLAGCGSGNGEEEQDSSQEAQTTEETPTPQEEPAEEETSGENVEEDSEDQEEKVEISIPEQEGLVAGLHYGGGADTGGRNPVRCGGDQYGIGILESRERRDFSGCG